jgi:tetratricopeptide (TPR) repeat protein
MSLSPQEIEQLARQELGVYRRGERLDRTEGIRQQYQNRTEGAVSAIKDVWEPELLRRGLKQMSDETAELGQSLVEKDDSLRPFPTGSVSERALSVEGWFVRQSPKEQMKETFARRSALGDPGFRRDRFSAARDSALRKGPILWGLQTRHVTLEEPLQQASKWEGEPKVDEAIAHSGKRDAGGLRIPMPLQEQGQRDGFPKAKERVWDRDVLERIRQQLDDLRRSVDVRLQAGPDETREAKSTKRAGQQPVRSTTDFVGLDSLKAGSLYEPQEAADGEMEVSEDELYFDEVLAEIRTRGSSGKRSIALDGLDELSQADRPKTGMIHSGASLWSARAKRIMGPHKSLESFSEAKFSQHMRAAESYLRQGRYYRAADSFALASIYKLDLGEAGSDPAQAFGLALSLAGRGHALFAAGEYISSALFLSRALEIDPEYARAEIDLVTMLGGTDKLWSRIDDVKEWLGRSGADQLQFLLGYVYYRMGRLQEAKEAIDTAYEKMPESPAADTVKRAIDDAIAGQ